MEKCFAIVALMFCLSGVSKAQEGILSGVITDGVYNVPLFSARIDVPAAAKHTISDLDGQYKLTLPAGLWEVVVSCKGLGSRTKLIEIFRDGETSLNLTLGASTFSSESGLDKEANKAAASILQIQKRFIQKPGFQRLDQVLDYLPGIDMIDGQLNIRGSRGYAYGAGSNVTVLLDGIPIMRAESAFPDWDFLPMSYLEEIEIIKAASSVQYGSSALGGIINLKTRQIAKKARSWASIRTGITQNPPGDDELSGSDKAWWGNAFPNNQSLSFGHERPIGDFTIRLIGNAFRENSWRQHEQDRNARVATALSYSTLSRTGETRLNTSISADFQKGERTEFLIWNGIGTDLYKPWSQLPMQENQSTKFIISPQLSLERESIGWKLELKARYYSSNNQNQINQSIFSKGYFAQAQSQKIWQSGLSLVTGLSGNYNQVEAQIYQEPNKVFGGYAAYGQLEQELFDVLSVSAGARYETNDVTGLNNESQPVMRFGANYQASSGTFLRTSIGQGFRFPSTSERFTSVNLGSLLQIFPNPDLKPERGWSAEIGIKQLLNFFNWHGSFDVAIFSNRYQDLTEFTFTNINRSVGFQSQNRGTAKIRGVEANLDTAGKLRGRKVHLWIGHTYLQPLYANEQLMKYRFSHSLKAHASMQFGKLDLSTSLRYRSNMEEIDVVFSTLLPDLAAYREQHDEGVAVLDLRAAYSLHDWLELSFICNNITNKEYSIRPALIESPRNYNLKLAMQL